MKIAHLLPASVEYPLREHNGRYEWVLDFAVEQAARGHDVTLFCNKQSSLLQSNIKFEGIDSSDQNPQQNNIKLIQSALADETYDIYHSHFDALHYSQAHLTEKKIVFTMHWSQNEKLFNAALECKSQNVIAIPVTKYQHEINKEHKINSSDYIYHGIKLDNFKNTKSIEKENKLIFIGRVCEGKGVKEAIDYALISGNRLDIYGKSIEKDLDYFEELKGRIDGERIRYLGGLDHSRVPEEFAKAKAFLFPSIQEEAFGLVYIESQAAGTPIITADIGSNSELVIHGKTGFLCKDPQEYIDALNRLDEIDSKDCIENASKFDFYQMVDKYMELYQKLVI